HPEPARLGAAVGEVAPALLRPLEAFAEDGDQLLEGFVGGDGGLIHGLSRGGGWFSGRLGRRPGTSDQDGLRFLFGQGRWRDETPDRVENKRYRTLLQGPSEPVRVTLDRFPGKGYAAPISDRVTR